VDQIRGNICRGWYLAIVTKVHLHEDTLDLKYYSDGRIEKHVPMTLIMHNAGGLVTKEIENSAVLMGDMFQIYAKSEWNLTPKQLSSFFALFGGINVLSHAVGGVLVRRMGIRLFTILAVASKLMTAVGTACFGYHGSVIGLLLGFLGAAQTLGIVAALVAAGTATGLSQGELAGERAALLALLKVVGPILYSALLVQGELWWGTKRCPLFFNIGLSVVALVVSWVHLRD
jgi:hypothetical protein